MRLIDADALKALFENVITCRSEIFNAQPYDHYSECFKNAIKILDSMPTVPQFGQWISPKDLRPQLDQEVICSTEIDRRIITEAYKADPSWWTNGFIKYWMPMPEVPKDDR